MNVHNKIDNTCRDTGKEIKSQESSMTEAVLHRATKEMKEPHIPEDVQPSFMQKHVGQEGQIVIERKAVDIRPPRVRVPGRDKAEGIEDHSQKIPRNGYFKEENDPVYNDQGPGNGRKFFAENGVF